MKHVFFLSITVFFTLSCTQDSQTNYYKIINDNSQNTYLQTVKQLDTCCNDRTQSDFVQCFFTLTNTDQKEIFKQLTSARRKELLTHFSYQDYIKFLDAYSEHDWKNLHDTLTEDEKKIWPKTVKEQFIMIKNIKKVAQNNNICMDIAMIGAGMIISPIVYAAYYGYVGYGLLHDNKHPFKENRINQLFEKYMKSTFEL